MNKKIMSIDAETNGLWGKPFAVAVIVYDQEGKEIDKVCYRLRNEFVTDDWVKEKVLPVLDFPVTHVNNLFDTQIGKKPQMEREYKEMLKDFAEFYLKYKSECEVLWHMGQPVEAFLFRELVRLNLIGAFEAPYTPIELSTILDIEGEKADSPDAYVEKYNLEISEYGSTHNPLYDCEVAAKVYFDIMKRR